MGSLEKKVGNLRKIYHVLRAKCRREDLKVVEQVILDAKQERILPRSPPNSRRIANAPRQARELHCAKLDALKLLHLYLLEAPLIC